MNESFEKRENFMQRLGGLAVEVIGPALVMLMVGSLTFFLIEVFYQGPYIARMKWVFALFTFAAVLISRISIDLGFERAMIYGFVLALATLMVASRFMSSSSMFGMAGPVGNLMLLLVIWWCAARLTWDCTFIDKTRDASGQGMIDLAIDRVNRFRNPVERDSAQQGEATDVAQPASHKAVLDLFFKRRQPNTPGLWVFYFLIAGLPIFGIGQIFLGMNNQLGHQAAARHFAVYMIATLCLLMLTSVLGLHRYLSRQNATLPSRVAKRWMITGTILAIAIIGITFWLPRPTPAYSIANWLPRLTSRDLEPSRVSFGRDGQKQDDRNTNINSGPQSRDRGEPAKGGDGGQSGSPQTSSDGSAQGQSGNSTNNQSKSGQEGKGNSGGDHDSGKADSKGSSSKGGGSKSKGGASKSKGSGSKTKGGDSAKGEQSKSEQSKGDQSKGEQSKGEQSKGEQSKGDQSKGEQSKGEQSKGAGGQKSSGPMSPRQLQQQRQANRDQPQQNQGRTSPRSQGNGNRADTPTDQNSMSGFFSAIGTLFQMLFYLILLVVIAFFAFKYRHQLMPAIRSFLAELAEFWSKLFARKPKPEQIQEQGRHLRPERPLPGFIQFRNPFTSGEAESWTTEQLVRYTFQAMEAWGRDVGSGRGTDQTPHEFAAQLTRRSPSLRAAAKTLVDLYCEVAYSKRSVSRKSAMQLEHLWTLMSATPATATASV